MALYDISIRGMTTIIWGLPRRLSRGSPQKVRPSAGGIALVEGISARYIPMAVDTVGSRLNEGAPMEPKWNRRDWLRSLGALALTSTVAESALGRILQHPLPDIPEAPHPPMEKAITAVVAGAGNRGNTYARYSQQYPAELKIVGFAEPIPVRRERFAKKYAIDPQHQFTTWEEIFTRPKLADVVIITTPDALHYGPAMGALEKGYDILLEKPIAQTWKQCTDIMELAEKNRRIVAICHVLRYAPFFRKIKEVIDSGLLGRMVSIQLLEPVEHIHMSHSFVRGNWRNAAESNPMLLAKSCHDLDLLVWYVGKPCLRVGSAGSLTWFRKENAPPGSTPRCTDGCAVEKACPYSALKIYHQRRAYLHHFDLPLEGDQGPAILENLKTGPYGRCVYRCDNDVVDHQVVLMEFQDSITASFSMEAFTSYGGRRIRVMGSMGDIVGDESDLVATNFRTGEVVRSNVKEFASLTSGHGGGDFGLVQTFLRAVNERDPGRLPTTVQEAMESHLIGFKAEEGREKGTVVSVRG
jgi:predicted dehydrogenase